MSWKKCLYLQQDHPNNYMEIQRTDKKRNTSETHEDINRVVIRISVVVLNFCLFRAVVDEGCCGMSRTSWLSFTTPFIGSFLENKGPTGIDLKPSFLLLTFVYLLSPLIRALALEVSSDTIYMYFAATQFFFVIDSVSASIHNDGGPVEMKDAAIPLTLEEGINIPKRVFSNQILGITSYFLGFILLSSRLQSPVSVFNLLCLTFMGYIVLPKHLERLCLHRRASTVFVLYLLVSAVSFLSGSTAFYVYNCLVVLFYLVSQAGVWILERDMRQRIKHEDI